MSTIQKFISGKTETLSTPADFGTLIQSIQFLNKHAVPHYRSVKDYTADVELFFNKLREKKDVYAQALTENLGYPRSLADVDLTETIRYMASFPESTKFQPQHVIPDGLIAVWGSWSSPLYRFLHLVIPALLNEGSVLLFCEPEVSSIYCSLAEDLTSTALSENRLVVLPITDAEVIDTLMDHPSIHAIQGQTHLYMAPRFRNRILAPEKNYVLHFGAHNPVLFLNDCEESLLPQLLEQSLNYQIRSEIRFNRWFIQEKVYPDVIAWIQKTLKEKEALGTAAFGSMAVRSYREAFDTQTKELRGTKHWMYPDNPNQFNICTDFSNCSPLHQTELLGPLLTITRFKNGPEATKFAGTTQYSNATAIITASKDKYTELAGQQRTPFVFHNSLPTYFESSMNSGSRHCALKTSEAGHSQKRIILY